MQNTTLNYLHNSWGNITVANPLLYSMSTLRFSTLSELKITGTNPDPSTYINIETLDPTSPILVIKVHWRRNTNGDWVLMVTKPPPAKLRMGWTIWTSNMLIGEIVRVKEEGKTMIVMEFVGRRNNELPQEIVTLFLVLNYDWVERPWYHCVLHFICAPFLVDQTFTLAPIRHMGHL